jgi:uncharacterized ferritin-like protein (DUF455 family)
MACYIQTGIQPPASEGKTGLMDFRPFILCQSGERPPKPRPMHTPEGLGDRMRTAAFAELQAIAAFQWATEKFMDVSQALRDDWAAQVKDESRHYNLIRRRMEDLGLGLTDRPVSTALWESLQDCTTGREFCIRIAAAEERGRRAGVRLAGFLEKSDPDTASIFREIAADEVVHVALAATYFDWTPE